MCTYIHRKIHKKLRKLHINFPGENIAAVLCYLKFNVRSGTTVRIQLQKWNTHLHVFTQRQNNGSSSLDLHPVPYQRVDMVFSDDFTIKMRGGRQMDFIIALTVRYYVPMSLIYTISIVLIHNHMFFIHVPTYVPQICNHVPCTCTYVRT